MAKVEAQKEREAKKQSKMMEKLEKAMAAKNASPAKRAKRKTSSDDDDDEGKCIICFEMLPSKRTKANTIECSVCKKLVHQDCYFCAVPLKGINWERRHDPKYYATASTSTKPEPHSDSLRVPIHPSAQQTNTPSAQSTSTQQASSENVYTPLNESDKIHLFSQDDLDDLVRDLYLSKQLSELLASRLKDRNMLQKGKFRHSQ